MVDITKECKQIMECVREICGGRNRFTLLYVADVLKGSAIKKIMDNNHNNIKFWGCLKKWDKVEIERILRKLVVEGYLREDLIFSKDIPQAYLYLGAFVNKLMSPNSTIKLELGIKSNSKSIKTVTASTSTPFTTSTKGNSEDLNNLQSICYHELLDLCRKMSLEKNINLASIMNIQALKAMSEIMPETEEDFKKIPHVTNTNYLKYGEPLLAITKTYAAQRKFLIDDNSIDESDEELMSVDLTEVHDSIENIDWEREAFVAKESKSSGSGSRGGRSNRGGFKRKRNYNYKSSTSKKTKVNTPKKSSSWNSSGAKRDKVSKVFDQPSTSRQFMLLPVPGSK